MKRLTIFICLAALPLAQSVAQDAPKSLASTLEVYVFPADGQTADQQSKDEVECYSWAVSNTGSDPFDLQKQNEQAQAQAEQQVAQTQAATQGAGARGAVKGAAAGALIGEIADDDAGKGAAYGAAAGVVRGRRKGRAAKEQATSQAAQQSEQREEATAEQLTNFKNAFSVCLEAKDYMVKY